MHLCLSSNMDCSELPLMNHASSMRSIQSILPFGIGVHAHVNTHLQADSPRFDWRCRCGLSDISELICRHFGCHLHHHRLHCVYVLWCAVSLMLLQLCWSLLEHSVRPIPCASVQHPSNRDESSPYSCTEQSQAYGPGRPFWFSQFQLLVDVSPWRDDFGTRFSLVSRSASAMMRTQRARQYSNIVSRGISSLTKAIVSGNKQKRIIVDYLFIIQWLILIRRNSNKIFKVFDIVW